MPSATITTVSDSSRAAPRRAASFLHAFVIALTAFLTLVDLFATQAILPTLVQRYGTTPAMMSVAVNASTIGMAISGLVVALIARHIDRRQGIWISLALLAIPTTLLGFLPDLTTFTILRIVQGIFMAAAFTLTLAYLAEHASAASAATAAAAYITGNVASNLFGRLLAAALVDHLGLAANFYVFALLNLAGAVLVFLALSRTPPMAAVTAVARSAFAAWGDHLRDGGLRAAFAIGFCILFAFIGTFTFVNFVLVRPPLSLGMMQLGFVYVVFLPSILTTPFAGDVVRRWGTRPTFRISLAVAGVGLPLLLVPSLITVLAGMVLVAVGTFFAQAVATGFVGRAAKSDRAAASGIYLACYFLGGLAGSAVLGQAFDRLGWWACVAGVGVSLVVAAALAARLRSSDTVS